MDASWGQTIGLQMTQKALQVMDCEGCGFLWKVLGRHIPPKDRLGAGVVPQGGRGAAAALEVEEELLPEVVGGHTGSF
ncbi:hypothetical protein [Deinococcus saxicola]|uniref:hypothetical protein n=1 Tax=Deinococcus saxicola TaxID=249406 RepID=UPI0039EF2192